MRRLAIFLVSAALGCSLSNVGISLFEGNDRYILWGGATVILAFLALLLLRSGKKVIEEGIDIGEVDVDLDDRKKLMQITSAVTNFTDSHTWSGGSSQPENTTVYLVDEDE